MSDLLDHYEELRSHGARFAIAAKAVAPCDLHPDIIEVVDSDRLKEACMMANSAITRNEINYDRKELTDAIKTVIDEAAYDCPRCEKMLRD